MSGLMFKLYCFLWSFERSHFYRDLADAISRKVGIRTFLERAESNARILKDTTGARVYRAMSMKLASGQASSISQLVRGVAPRSDQLLLRAVDGAVAGEAEALMMCADAVEFQQRSFKSIALELLVPILAVPLVGSIVFITSGIVTGIAANGAPPEVWDGFNGFVRWLAESVSGYAVAIVIGAAVAVAAAVTALPRWIGNLRLKAEGWPVLGLYRDYNAAVVLSSLAVMLRSGKSMREALDALRGASSPWLRWHLSRIIRSIEDNPNDYLAAFGKGLMPPAIRARLASLVDAKKDFAEALVVIGTKEIASLERRVKLSAEGMKWVLTGSLVSIAVVLSLGIMTIASALSTSADPTTRLLHRAQQAQQR